MKTEIRHSLLLGSFILFLAVGIGAFGAHGLQKSVTEKDLKTYSTGVTYQFYHAFALIILGLLAKSFDSLKIKPVLYAFGVGILLFSFNCYFYALTQIKIFAMIVPLGGLLFLVGWLTLFIQLYRKIK